MSFSFLADLNAPQKLSFSHKLIEYLLKLEHSSIDDKIKSMRDLIISTIKKIIRKEEIFNIARVEYEKKEERFIEKTIWNEDKLDLKYRDLGLQFMEIPSKEIKMAIDDNDINLFLQRIEEGIEIIEIDIKYCKKRTEFLLNEWVNISDELFDKLRTFEFRGLKKASSNLRIKILPSISEYKSNLKQGLVENTISRLDIMENIDEWLRLVKEDIFGDLTDAQINMLENINHALTAGELIDYIKNDKTREDLIYLLETGKIEIKLDKIIDELI